MEIVEENACLRALGKLPYVLEFCADNVVCTALLHEYNCQESVSKGKLFLDLLKHQVDMIELAKQQKQNLQVRADQLRREGNKEKTKTTKKKRKEADILLEAELMRMLEKEFPDHKSHCEQAIDYYKEILKRSADEMEKIIKLRDAAIPAATEVIERHYKRQSLILHPDRNTEPGCTDRFEKFKAARNCLRDSCLRQKYVSDLLPLAHLATLPLAHMVWKQTYTNSNASVTTTTTASNRKMLTGGIFHDKPRKPLIHKTNYKTRRVQLILCVTNPDQFYRYCCQVDVYASRDEGDDLLTIATLRGKRLPEGAAEIPVHAGLPEQGIWYVSWRATFHDQKTTPRSEQACINLMNPLQEQLLADGHQIVELANRRVAELDRVKKRLDSVQHTLGAGEISAFQDLFHRAMVQGRQSLARLKTVADMVGDTPNTQAAREALQDRLRAVVPSKTRLDQAAAARQKKNRLKNFKAQVAQLLETGRITSWINRVGTSELQEMGGDNNRIYQLLVENFQVDALTLHIAAARKDLFSTKQCQTIQNHKVQVQKRLREEEKAALEQARLARIQQELDEQARAAAMNSEREQEAELENLYENFGEVESEYKDPEETQGDDDSQTKEVRDRHVSPCDDEEATWSTVSSNSLPLVQSNRWTCSACSFYHEGARALNKSCEACRVPRGSRLAGSYVDIVLSGLSSNKTSARLPNTPFQKNPPTQKRTKKRGNRGKNKSDRTCNASPTSVLDSKSVSETHARSPGVTQKPTAASAKVVAPTAHAQVVSPLPQTHFHAAQPANWLNASPGIPSDTPLGVAVRRKPTWLDVTTAAGPGKVAPIGQEQLCRLRTDPQAAATCLDALINASPMAATRLDISTTVASPAKVPATRQPPIAPPRSKPQNPSIVRVPASWGSTSLNASSRAVSTREQLKWPSITTADCSGEFASPAWKPPSEDGAASLSGPEIATCGAAASIPSRQQTQFTVPKPAAAAGVQPSTAAVEASSRDSLLAFLESNKSCIKGDPHLFCQWLSASEDIENLADLIEAASDEEYFTSVLQPGNGDVKVKGFKTAAFRAAVLAASESSSPRTAEDLPELLCPITLTLMTDPVVAADGYTYERAAIVDWFERQQLQIQQAEERLRSQPSSDLDKAVVERGVLSPMTSAALPNLGLVENQALRSMARDAMAGRKVQCQESDRSLDT